MPTLHFFFFPIPAKLTSPSSSPSTVIAQSKSIVPPSSLPTLLPFTSASSVRFLCSFGLCVAVFPHLCCHFPAICFLAKLHIQPSLPPTSPHSNNQPFIYLFVLPSIHSPSLFRSLIHFRQSSVLLCILLATFALCLSNKHPSSTPQCFNLPTQFSVSYHLPLQPTYPPLSVDSALILFRKNKNLPALKFLFC